VSQSKFIQESKTILRNRPGLFEALIEFETTGKIRTKTRANFTIDRSIYLQYRKYCKKHGINMSQSVERYIKSQLEKIRK
jgi:hypothetical protein